MAGDARPEICPGLCWQKLFWVLVAGSVFGVAWEHCVNLLLHGRFYGGRGLVWGPFNLVYGCGAVLLTLLLWPLRDGQAHKLLLAGMLAGSAYEVGCSLLQEAVFGAVSWNYDRELLPLLGGAPPCRWRLPGGCWRSFT